MPYALVGIVNNVVHDTSMEPFEAVEDGGFNVGGVYRFGCSEQTIPDTVPPGRYTWDGVDLIKIAQPPTIRSRIRGATTVTQLRDLLVEALGLPEDPR